MARVDVKCFPDEQFALFALSISPALAIKGQVYLEHIHALTTHLT
jgi:hypothetical protein